MQPILIRCSSLDRLAGCAGAEATAADAREHLALAERVDSEPAVLGTAFHTLAARRREGELITVEHVNAVAEENAVDRAQLLWLWSRYDPDALAGGDIVWVEERFTMNVGDGIVLTGQPDVARYFEAEGLLCIDDHKTGRQVTDPRDSWQLRGYAALCLDRLTIGSKRVERIELRVQSPRGLVEDDAVHAIVGYDAIAEMVRSVEGLAHRAGLAFETPILERQYRVGDACGYCVGRGVCPAFAQNLHGALAVAMQIDAGSIGRTAKAREQERRLALADAMRNAVLENPQRAWALKAAAAWVAEGMRDAFGVEVELHGPIDYGDGNVIDWQRYEARVTITTDLVRDALTWAGVESEQADAVIARIEAREREERKSLRRMRKK
jgi:PD-(D/E)XK nuclease superfamily